MSVIALPFVCHLVDGGLMLGPTKTEKAIGGMNPTPTPTHKKTPIEGVYGRLSRPW